MEIRAATAHAELHACVDLMMDVWNLSPKDAVPFNQLHAAHEWGGQVLVAIDAGRLAGFCYGFGGRQYGRPALLSHMLAVRPEYRAQGLGYKLKLAQARWALENGYAMVTWTYDPLEAVNANLNLGRLGGVVRQYLVNHYGEMSDGLNRGLPSDRLLVEWHLKSHRVEALLSGAAPPTVPPADRTCPVPLGFQSIKASDPAEALRWRLRVRGILQSALADGLMISGFQKEGDGGAYLLTPKTEVAYAD